MAAFTGLTTLEQHDPELFDLIEKEKVLRTPFHFLYSLTSFAK